MNTLHDLAHLCGGIPKGRSVVINGVSSNSSSIKNGDAFVAVFGTKTDGHAFVNQAFQNGASCAVVSKPEALDDRPGIVVPDTRIALSRLSAHFYGNPSRELLTIGVTGTNGKTTTVWLIWSLLNSLGTKALRIGTLGISAPGIVDDPGVLTTPDPVSLHRTIRFAKDKGVGAVVMEASSHALDQMRVEDISFDGAIFSNLTRDHLDYHQTMESYFNAKRHLFELLERLEKSRKAPLINIDDPYGRELSKNFKNAFTYGRADGADFQITDFEQDLSGSRFDIRNKGNTYPVRSRLIGLYNAQNIASAFGVLVELGFSPHEIASRIESIPQVPGRLQSVGDSSLGIYVDYAHTPDALENVLHALKEVVKNDLWVIFGCGGDRDRGKRPQMAEIAQKLSDRVVVTSDNPRTEDPNRIIEDILSSGVKPHLTEVDRRKAIAETLSQAKKGDVVLIAGKGHEEYQILGTEKVHFSDVEEATRFMETRR